MTGRVGTAVASVALALAVGPSPAHAEPHAITLVCEISYPHARGLNWGVPGTCAAEGSVRGAVALTFDSWAPPELCGVFGVAAGRFAAPGFAVSFTWSRQANQAMVNVTGPAFDGVGTAVFVPRQAERVCTDLPLTETATFVLTGV